MASMSTLKAVVRKGRLVLDEPTELPEGTVVELTETDPYAYLDDQDDPFASMPAEERAKLDAALARGIAELDAGLGRPIEDFLAEL